jgi:hypothetical protein
MWCEVADFTLRSLRKEVWCEQEVGLQCCCKQREQQQGCYLQAGVAAAAA